MNELDHTRPASPDQFVGRASEIKKFNKFINSFNNGKLVENTIIITGPPGIGKSSFLNFVIQRDDTKFLKVNMRGGDISNLFHTSFPKDKRLIKILSSMQKFYEVAIRVALNMTPASPLVPLIDLIPKSSRSEQINLLEILKKEDKKLKKERKKLVIVLDQAETFFQKSTYCPEFLEKLTCYISNLPNILLCIGIQLRFNGPLWHKCQTIANLHKTIEISQLKDAKEAKKLIKKRVPHLDFEDEVIELIYEHSEAIPLDVIWITNMLVEGEKEIDKELWDTSKDKISNGYRKLLKEANESTGGLAKKIYEFLNSFEGDKFAPAKIISREIQENYVKVKESCTIMEDRGLLLGSEDGFRIFRGEHFLKGKVIDKLVWQENENRIKERYSQAFLKVVSIAGELGTEVLLAMTKLREGAVGIYTSEIAEMTMQSENEIEKVCSKLAEMRILLKDGGQYKISNDRFYDWLYEVKLNKEEKQIIAFKTYSRVFQTFKDNNNFEGMSQMLQLMIDEHEKTETRNLSIERIINEAIDESLKNINDFIRIIDFRRKLSFLEQFERIKTVPWEKIENLFFDLINLEFRERAYGNALILLGRLAKFYEEVESSQGLLGVARAFFLYGDKLKDLKSYKLAFKYKLASNFYEEASFLFERLGNRKELRESSISMRNCLIIQAKDSFEKKNYYDCIKLLERAIEISKQLEDEKLIQGYYIVLIRSYLNQAEIDKKSNHYNLSLANFKRAYELSDQISNEKNKRRALIGLGSLREASAKKAMKAGDLDRALEILENSKKSYFMANEKNKVRLIVKEIEKVNNMKNKKDRSHKKILKEKIPVHTCSMIPRVITIASGKGGTGKTTTVANLGTALALMGKKTVILDADIAMANLALILGMEKSKVTLHEVLAGKEDIKDAIYKGPGGVIVVPCGVSLSGFQKSDPEKLQNVLTKLLKGTDFLLIDAPPGLSRDGVIPLAVADEVILVVNPDISSMADALKTKVMTEMVDSRVSGVILNRANFENADLPMQEVQKMLGVKIIEIIPNDWEVRRSAAFKTPIVIRSEDSPAAIAFREAAAKIIGEESANPEYKQKEGVISRFKRSVFGE